MGRPTLYNAVCNSTDNDMIKVLTGLPEGYEPQAGDFVMVKFSWANYIAPCSFSINSKTYAIKFNGLDTNGIASAWKANSVFPFYFDGTNFNQLSYAKETDDNTTYTGIYFDQFLDQTYIKVNNERGINHNALVLERADSTFDAALTNGSQTANKNKPVNTGTDFKVNGLIWFNGGTSYFDKDKLCAVRESQRAQVQGYSSSAFVNYALNGADHLREYSWVYLVGIPQENPMVYRLDPNSFTSWYTTDIPTEEDGKVYILLGRFNYNSLSISSREFNLFSDHPAYWFKDGAFRPYLTGEAAAAPEKRPTLYNANDTSSSSDVTRQLNGLPEGYEPHEGDIIMVKYVNSNSSGKNCVFRISGNTKTYNILYNGTNTNLVTSSWAPGSICPFYFDGTKFHQLCYARNQDNAEVFGQPLDYCYLNINNARPILGYQFVLERQDGTFDNACLTDYTSRPNEANTITDFKVDGLICFYSGSNQITTNSTAQCDKNFWIQLNHTTYIFRAFNSLDHLKNNSWVYLIGIPKEDPMVFRLNPGSYISWYTTDIPKTEDGKVYIRLGRYSTQVFSLFADHPAYWFKDGLFRPYLTRGDTPAHSEPRPSLFNAMCDTAGDVNIKDLTELPGGYEPAHGDTITVRFASGNSAANCAFTIASGAAQYQIKFNGLATNTTSSAWKPGGVFQFFFDGTDFHQLSYAN